MLLIPHTKKYIELKTQSRQKKHKTENDKRITS